MRNFLPSIGSRRDEKFCLRKCKFNGWCANIVQLLLSKSSVTTLCRTLQLYVHQLVTLICDSSRCPIVAALALIEISKRQQAIKQFKRLWAREIFRELVKVDKRTSKKLIKKLTVFALPSAIVLVLSPAGLLTRVTTMKAAAQSKQINA